MRGLNNPRRDAHRFFERMIADPAIDRMMRTMTDHDEVVRQAEAVGDAYRREQRIDRERARHKMRYVVTCSACGSRISTNDRDALTAWEIVHERLITGA